MSSSFGRRGIPTSSKKGEVDSHDHKIAENEFSMELTIDEGAQKLGCINPKRIYEKMDELVTVLRVKS